ncbi:peptidoglycan hydrolase [Bacillus luteolus]|uniref:Peptidoglycan hydrolase n=1 Tax=Litchfieldia luteola TaxID=682179 RepID=A0ABR9QJC3_9BACI|nr:glycosyl hydrolase family 18 protein [Cytobacillus luteolus]MBE4908597.1 peptidoglycan hydrolase [Cytobacillus luteolus]MBP1941452.1 spore germination protein YaaH [Cytobacillus luteolus]
MSRIETHKQNGIKTSTIVVGLIASLVLISTSLFFFIYPFPSEEKVIYTSKEHPIIYKGEMIEEEALIKDNIVYLPLTFFKEHIDDSFVMDVETNSIIITTTDKVIQMPTDSLTYLVNEQPFKVEIPILLENEEIPYIALELLKNLYPVQIEHLEDSGVVIVRTHGEPILYGTVDAEQKVEELRLRSKTSLTSPYVAEVTEKEQIEIIREENSFYYVRKNNGVAGYLPKDSITLANTRIVTVEYERVKKTHPAIQWPINVTWEAVYSVNPDVKKLPQMPGVNVVSPTWFHLENNEGDISNLGSLDYVNWAKSRNYQVWGLFSNDFDPDKTHEAFKNYETRMKMVRQLLQYAEMYKLDGINIDIENVRSADGPLVTQFVREATPYFHQAGLIVSMDITFISGSEMWSKFYEREKLAEIVDYIMVMAYDEHWGTSPVAGSVASLPWVENNLKELLKVVPHDRLILGVPLYARIWKEQETEGGNIEVSSKAYSMDVIREWIEERNLTPNYDEATGQNYVEYRNEEEKATYKIWIEDELSLQKRGQLVHKYNLAGVATWSRFFANDLGWITLDESLNKLEATTEKSN